MRPHEAVTDAVAGAAITSPWWLDAAHTWAQWALPFLGCAWLGMQMYYKWKKERNASRPDQTD